MPPADELFAGLPDAILTLDPSGKVTGWHGSAERLLGWSAGEVIGLDAVQLLHPRLPNGDQAGFPRPSMSGSSSPGHEDSPGPGIAGPEQELLVKSKDDSDVWVSMACGMVAGSHNGSPQTVAALRDIRQRKGVDIAKSDVISSVAHELRSPLTSIKGFAATLVRRWDRFTDERRRQILATIEADADRVTRLITELLDLSRLEEGRLQLRRQPVEVSLLAMRVADRLKERSAGHSLSCNFPAPLPAVMADPDKIEQVLTNLIENALKYTEGGIVEIGGSLEDSFVRVTVTDQGGGIPADHRHNVFRKFFRSVDPASPASAAHAGSGLGLYICKGLIEAHGGTIWVEDAPHGGAAFAFTLPLN